MWSCSRKIASNEPVSIRVFVIRLTQFQRKYCESVLIYTFRCKSLWAKNLLWRRSNQLIFRVWVLNLW